MRRKLASPRRGPLLAPAFATHELRGPNTVPACSYLAGHQRRSASACSIRVDRGGGYSGRSWDGGWPANTLWFLVVADYLRSDRLGRHRAGTGGPRRGHGLLGRGTTHGGGPCRDRSTCVERRDQRRYPVAVQRAHPGPRIWRWCDPRGRWRRLLLELHGSATLPRMVQQRGRG